MRSRHLILALFVLVSVSLFVSLRMNILPGKAAFGTSPPWVRNDHLLPGTSFEQIINLSRNDPDQDMKVNIRITGDKEIQNWIKIENQSRLVMKAGETILPMKVIVEVPKRAALKDYRGGIFVTLEPVQAEGQQGGTVAITLGANITVELSVIGTKVTNYRIQSISTTPVEEGQPLALNVELENFGNTEISTLNGQAEIYDEKETQILKSLPFGPLSQPVSPDEKGRVQIRFDQFILDPGNYWIIVKVYKDEEVIYENRLYQTVMAKFVPVITPEDVIDSRPSLPKLPTAEVEDVSDTQVTPDTLKPAASPVQPPAENRLFLILGLAGLGFGLLAMLGIIAVLVIVLRNQRQANLERYLSTQFKNSDKTV